MGIQLEDFINKGNMKLTTKEIKTFLEDFYGATEIKEFAHLACQPEKIKFNICFNNRDQKLEK